jgi:hypothetical protein
MPLVGIDVWSWNLLTVMRFRSSEWHWQDLRLICTTRLFPQLLFVHRRRCFKGRVAVDAPSYFSNTVGNRRVRHAPNHRTSYTSNYSWSVKLVHWLIWLLYILFSSSSRWIIQVSVHSLMDRWSSISHQCSTNKCDQQWRGHTPSSSRTTAFVW